MKKRTPFKKPNILLPALFALALLCALFASCENLLHKSGGDDNTSVWGGYEKPDSSSPGTLTVSVRIGGSGARSAAPSAQQEFIYAASLYPDGGVPSDDLSIGEADGSTITFMFEKPPLAEGGTLTPEIFAFAQGTAEADLSRESALLTGKETGLVAEGASMTVSTMTLTPNKAAAAPKGTVSLNVKVPSGCTLEIDDTANFVVTGASPNFTVQQNDDENGDEISAGTYSLMFNVKKGGETVHAFPDEINVWPGMCTDTWSGLAKGAAREITQAMLETTVYVCGSDPGWYASQDMASNDNAGSFNAPFATIQKAIDTVIARNYGSHDYTIYIDGTFAASSSAALADFKNVSEHLNVKIAGLAGQKATLDGKNTARIIVAGTDDAPKDISLTLENLTVQNGNSTGRGAGVAICSLGTNSHTIKNCEIKNNSATYGAAIYNEHGSLDLESCEISGNKATSAGGAVYNGGSATAVLTMSDVSITNNTAGNGGGIFIGGDGSGSQDGASTVRISDSSVVIQNNTSEKSEGDGICIWQGRLELSGSAKIDDGIYLNDSSQHVTVAGNLTATTPVATITPSSYMEDGQVLDADGENIPKITDTICEKFALAPDPSSSKEWRLVPDGMGAYGMLEEFLHEIYVDGSAGSDTNKGRQDSPLKTVAAAAKKKPGTIYLRNTTSETSSITISVDTKILVWDGASEAKITRASTYKDVLIYIPKSNSTCKMNDISIDGNGVEASRTTILNYGTLEITGGEITNCKTTEDDGGAIYTRKIFTSDPGGKLTINGTKISGNTARKGGGVYLYNNATFIMEGNSTISGNTATNKGGGVYVYDESTFTMKGGEISRNKATSEDSGLYYGGGVCIEGESTFTMYSGTVSDNTAKEGGGVFVYRSAFTMKDGTVSDNSSSYRGGGVYVDMTGTFTMEDGTISGNTATSDGGGVYVDSMGTETKFTMEKGTISGNKAENGGGVYCHNIFMMEDGTISGNMATKNGGGVYVDRCTFTLNGGTISGNNATTGGGGVYINNFYSDSLFTNNGGTVLDEIATYR